MSVKHLANQLARDARRFGGLPLWLMFRVLPALLLASLAALLLWVPPLAARPVGQEMSLEDVESGRLLLREEGTEVYAPAINQHSRVHFDVSGLVASVSLEQSFRNDGDRWMEGVYAFPLPDGAAVRYLEMTIGERRIVGSIREKEAARQIYQAAAHSGRKASLVEQQRPNLFTNRVANIGPGETVSVRLEYVQAVAVDGDRFSLRFPMTITPRYQPGRPLPADGDITLAVDPYLGWAVATDQVPDAAAISPLLHPVEGSDQAPINPIELTARLDMGMPLAAVESPYHRIAMNRQAGVYEIRLAAGISEMDRDFELRWRPLTGSAPTAALFTEQRSGEYFGLAMVLPPAADQAAPAQPREMIFVVDTSGSMGGVPIEQARAAVGRALLQLRPEDRFNIIEFNSGYRRLYREPVPASRHHVQRAREFVRQLQASGGTEMLPALQAALEAPSDPDLYRERASLRQVIFMTDGAVGNEQALFETIAQRLGGSRLFTVGIGSAPNSWFMRRAAEFGRGSHTHIGHIDQVGEKMDALFDRLSRPAVVSLRVDWPVEAEAWPERIPDLYVGEPLMVAARFGTTPPAGEVTISGEIAGRPWTRRLRLAAQEDLESGGGHAGVASLWARRKITGLLDQLVMGRDEKAVRAEVLGIALEHQLLSPYTSFVAVEETVSRADDTAAGREAVANTRPRGQSPQPFAFPRGASPGPVQLWLGLLLLFSALMVWVMRQEGSDAAPLRTG
jgi:Ca-activated chloride channel family protein